MEKGYTLEQPPHGYVRYVDHLGTDQRIVEAARISYGSPSKGEEKDKKLIDYLFKHRHTSPFEQCNITFNIKMPIFCMRQFVRHRTFRLNEFSGRYSEMPDQFFAPAFWRIQDFKNKQGSLPPEYKKGDENWISWHEGNENIARNLYEQAYRAYEYLLDRGVAKEHARIVLPLGLYTEIYINGDLHNLIHYFRLRTDAHAQQELQDIANPMLEITRKLFPWTMESYDRWKMMMVQQL